MSRYPHEEVTDADQLRNKYKQLTQEILQTEEQTVQFRSEIHQLKKRIRSRQQPWLIRLLRLALRGCLKLVHLLRLALHGCLKRQ